MACIVLHNIATTLRLPEPESDDDESDDSDDDDDPEPCEDQPTLAGRMARDRIVQQHFTRWGMDRVDFWKFTFSQAIMILHERKPNQSSSVLESIFRTEPKS